MGFWRDHMPADMFLRSGSDWHLDASHEHTFEAYLAERGIAPAEVDPIPIAVYLGYADWFTAQKKLPVDDLRVRQLRRDDGRFVAELEDGGTIEADAVVAAPGIAGFAALPPWAATLPDSRRAHTVDLVSFDRLSGARCLIVGGRQSAYEWAALLCDHGAQRVDLVHRHDVPRFAPADWSFVDAPSTRRCVPGVGGGPCRPAIGTRSCAGSGRSDGSPWSRGSLPGSTGGCTAGPAPPWCTRRTTVRWRT